MIAVPPTTHRVDVVDGVELRADVYDRPADDHRAGVLVWLHGGALSLGHRSAVPDFVRELAAAGVLVVSPDYRLAPQVTLDAIHRDVATALEWAQGYVDRVPERAAGPLVVAGESAGGYLALGTGLRADVRAVVAAYGYGTLDAPWYLEPSAHYRRAYPLITEAEARAVVTGPTTTDGRTPEDRWKFYLHCRQTGRWPELTAGLDRDRDHDRLRAASPLYRIDAAFPPTFLVHGDADTDVPVAESQALAAVLALHGVDHELLVLPGVDHGFVGPPGGPVPPPPAAALAEPLARAQHFIRRMLAAPGATAPSG